ncbi:MAG: TAT-variant-translocated molybdopterin oxidoreductase, partial [Bacteroidota bacterium]
MKENIHSKGNKGLWVGVQDNDPEVLEAANSEFTELPLVDSLSKEKSLEVGASRRDFLKFLGFSLGAATVAAGCDAPVRRAIPYVVKPDAIVPGVATYYASSYAQGGDYAAILVKTREGRPINIAGNTMSSVTKGGVCARSQASVLDLYDTNRLKGPVSIQDGELTYTNWGDIDKAMSENLAANAQIRIVTNTMMSPSMRQVFADFKAKYPNMEVITYDPISYSALLQANEACFGERVVPEYSFQNAEVIVSFGADFLATWLTPIAFGQQYVTNRKVNTANPKLSRHIQVESNMSVTGSNADNRILVKPSEQGAAIATLYNAIARTTGAPTINAPKLNAKATRNIGYAAEELLENKGQSLVVCGTNNIGEQILVNRINHLLGNYGKTIDFTHPSYQRQGIDEDIQNLIKEMNAGSVDAVFVFDGANPAFDLPNAEQFKAGMAKVKTKLSFAGSLDETAMLCDYVAPQSHYLESWGDVEPKKGHFALIQPTIPRLFDTRQVEESLLRWSASPNFDAKAEQPVFEYIRNYWKNNLFPLQSEFASFQTFWDSSLHDGIFEVKQSNKSIEGFAADVTDAASKISQPSNNEYEISFYETANIGAGHQANNPWLQEQADPITRCVWGNYLQVPVEWNGSRIVGVKDIGALNAKSKGDIVELTVGDRSQRVTAVPQFGQMAGTVCIALGYGREEVGSAGSNIGINTFPWIGFDKNGNVQYYSTNAVNFTEALEIDEEFACVQYHHTMGVTGKASADGNVINLDEEELGYQGSLVDRTIIYQGNINSYKELTEEIREKRAEAKHLNDATLYPYDEYQENVYGQGHHWGMHIDLNACVGCGACTVACSAENNVPVVGKKEVHRHHEMTWLRIDRYYYGDLENPSVVYQPMMCQHCDNAPCENVCPVAATNHSSEGLNQMTYNRCIGTRYCANNCPYKVRRFNWLDYTTADLFPGNQIDINGEEIPFGADNLTRMVLNPDVTVRSRGVIEKCSFCVQRIQEGKLTAKREGRKLTDADVRPACQTACVTGAITFGDMNDKNSEVSKAIKDTLTYRVVGP